MVGVNLLLRVFHVSVERERKRGVLGGGTLNMERENNRRRV